MKYFPSKKEYLNMAKSIVAYFKNMGNKASDRPWVNTAPQNYKANVKYIKKIFTFRICCTTKKPTRVCSKGTSGRNVHGKRKVFPDNTRMHRRVNGKLDYAYNLLMQEAYGISFRSITDWMFSGPVCRYHPKWYRPRRRGRLKNTCSKM